MTACTLIAMGFALALAAVLGGLAWFAARRVHRAASDPLMQVHGDMPRLPGHCR